MKLAIALTQDSGAQELSFQSRNRRHHRTTATHLHKDPLMEASAKPAKTAYEYFTVGNQAFKESLERSIAAMSEMNAYSKKNLEALIASATATAKGVETVGARAMAFSKKSIEGQIAAAKALAAAKSIQEAVELQTGFAKSAFETYVAEVNE